MKKTIKVISMGALALLLAACTSSASVLPDSPSFNQGNHDGCATAKGEYTKNSASFRGNADYQDGWYYGRKHCHPGPA